jgi:glycosyltransferase involved in cell wall biosynthesis
MKVLWCINIVIREAGELFQMPFVAQVSWMDHLSHLIRQEAELTICFPTNAITEPEYRAGERVTFCAIPRKSSNGYQYEKSLTQKYKEIMQKIKPDVIQIWGTEFPNDLNAIIAAQECGLAGRTACSVQGLVSYCARPEHFYGSLPFIVQHKYAMKNVLRGNNLYWFRKSLAKRGTYEMQTLRHTHNIIGRTDWDKACTYLANPKAKYFYNSETMRDIFYQKVWKYEKSEKHRIFMSQAGLPYKGMHYALEALHEIIRFYPDARLYVTGRSLMPGRPFQEQIRLGSYERYLQQMISRLHLEEQVVFLGTLDGEQMCEQYLKANVFILPSSIENSPNSLGEAMLLGTPCVAADVGGVKNLLEHDTEGFVYQHDAPYMLAYYIMRVFEESQEQVVERCRRGRTHAMKLYDPEQNKQQLLMIYRQMMEE